MDPPKEDKVEQLVKEVCVTFTSVAAKTEQAPPVVNAEQMLNEHKEMVRFPLPESDWLK